MKKLILTLSVLILSLTSFSQVLSEDDHKTKKDQKTEHLKLESKYITVYDSKQEKIILESLYITEADSKPEVLELERDYINDTSKPKQTDTKVKNPAYKYINKPLKGLNVNY